MLNRLLRPDVNLEIFAKCLIVLATLALSACAPSVNERIKVTVTVEDNGTLYVGSAVQQLICYQDLDIEDHSFNMGDCRPKGEAIPVKIGDKGWAFMILSGFDPSMPAKLRSSKELRYNADFYAYTIQLGRSKEHPNQPWSVPLDVAPMFVRFKDLKDRRTVERVGPREFDKYFGPSIKLVSITCVTTKELVTRGQIRDLLPWMEELGHRLFDETTLGDNDNVLTQISGANFKFGW